MKPQSISARHHLGYNVTFALESGDDLGECLNWLSDAGWRSLSADGWQRTPEGLPICPVHQEVMTAREKQGDIWHSHKVLDAQGGEHYCRGYAHKGATGFHIRAEAKPVPKPPKATAQPVEASTKSETVSDLKRQVLEARSREELAKAFYALPDEDMSDDDIVAMSAEELQSTKFYPEGNRNGKSMTFAEQLQWMIDSGQPFPAFFATTEI